MLDAVPLHELEDGFREQRRPAHDGPRAHPQRGAEQINREPVVHLYDAPRVHDVRAHEVLPRRARDWDVRLRVLGPDVLPQQVPRFDDVAPLVHQPNDEGDPLHAGRAEVQAVLVREVADGRAVAVGGRRRRAVLALPLVGGRAQDHHGHDGRVLQQRLGSFPLHQVLIHRARVRQPVRLVHELPIFAARVWKRGRRRAVTRVRRDRAESAGVSVGNREGRAGRRRGGRVVRSARTRTPVSGGRPPGVPRASRGSTRVRKNVSRAWRTVTRRRIHNGPAGGWRRTVLFRQDLLDFRVVPYRERGLHVRPPRDAACGRLVRHGCLSAPNGLRRCSYCRGKVVVEGGTIARGSRRFFCFRPRRISDHEGNDKTLARIAVPRASRAPRTGCPTPRKTRTGTPGAMSRRSGCFAPTAPRAPSSSPRTCPRRVPSSSTWYRSRETRCRR